TRTSRPSMVSTSAASAFLTKTGYTIFANPNEQRTRQAPIARLHSRLLCSYAPLLLSTPISPLLFPFYSPTMKQRTHFMALTKRQKQVLDFIANFVDEHGYCPSYEEIARGLQLASLATVHKHISVLEAKSYLKRGFNQSRSLELAPKYLQEQRRPKPVMQE